MTYVLTCFNKLSDSFTRIYNRNPSLGKRRAPGLLYIVAELSECRDGFIFLTPATLSGQYNWLTDCYRDYILIATKQNGLGDIQGLIWNIPNSNQNRIYQRILKHFYEEKLIKINLKSVEMWSEPADGSHLHHSERRCPSIYQRRATLPVDTRNWVAFEWVSRTSSSSDPRLTPTRLILCGTKINWNRHRTDS